MTQANYRRIVHDIRRSYPTRTRTLAMPVVGVLVAISVVFAAPIHAESSQLNNSSTVSISLSKASTKVGKPERVHVLSVRPMKNKVLLDWEAAATGSRPTTYQVKLVGRKWKGTRKTTMMIKGLSAGKSYQIKVRALKGKKRGKPVPIMVTMPQNHSHDH